MLAEFPHAENTLEEWRYQELVRLGFSPRWARAHARERVDLHELERLIGEGCPPRTAWRIVAPIDPGSAG